VEADEVLLRKAIVNLVVNAVEAAAETGEGAEVAVAVEEDESKGLAFVRVEDSGPGISMDDRSRIFTPFFTKKPDGTGLGLALVQKIAVAHNGDVEVESQSGGRTVFTLTLPAKVESPQPYTEWV
jgi:signal transduction histidine kinase